MYAHYDEEQAGMAEAVARALDAGAALAPAQAWRRMADIGVPALAVPHADDGMALGPRSIHAVAEALGRCLQTSPCASSALAATRLIDRLGREPLRRQWLQALGTGDAVLVLALGESHTDYALDAIRTRAEPLAGGWRLSGRKVVALHSEQAREWIVSARSPAGALILLVVQEGMPGLAVRRYACIDGSQACDLHLEGVDVGCDRQLGAPGPSDQSQAASETASQVLEEAVALAELALCAEAVGIQARLLEDTVRYTQQRQQFGAPIARLQVVQHRLVDMLVALEQARSLAWLLACEFDAASSGRRAYLVSAAKARAIASGRCIGMQAIHLHGGMGMTDELPVGRGVKRLLAIEHSFGDERYHLARIARHTFAGQVPA